MVRIMNVCSKCGRVLTGGIVFCDSCGARAVNQSNEQPQNPAPPPPQSYSAPPVQNYSAPPNNPQYPQQSYTPPAPPGKKSSGGKIAVIVLIAAVVIGILYWVGASSEDQYSPPPPAPEINAPSNDVPLPNPEPPPQQPPPPANNNEPSGIIVFSNYTGYIINTIRLGSDQTGDWTDNILGGPLYDGDNIPLNSEASEIIINRRYWDVFLEDVIVFSNIDFGSFRSFTFFYDSNGDLMLAWE
jgi:hypothetical protein